MIQTLSAILSACSGPVALFSDFDGTLVEIADHPDAVAVPSRLPSLLHDLNAALEGAIAIVTGRPISQVDDLLNLPEMTLSGGHGAEFRLHGHHATAPALFGLEAQEMARIARNAIGPDERFLIETKPSGIAVHYRNAPEREADARLAVRQAVAMRDIFQIIEGKKVIEVRPKGTDKGAATRRLMQDNPFAGRMPIFVGDDVTDEDAFTAVTELGGFGVKVGPGETIARFHIPDVTSVYALYEALRDMGLAADHIEARQRLASSQTKEGQLR